MDPGIFKKIIFFSRLPQDVLDSLGSEVEEISLLQDEVVVTEGDECMGIHFVIKGAIKVSRISPEGREQILSIIGPQQIFNGVPVFDGGPNPATATTLEPSILGLVPKKVLLNLVRENGVVAEGLLKMFSSRLRGLTTLVSDLTHLDVTGRVAKVLITYHQSSRQDELHMSQQDLASMVGTTREVAARALRTLEEQGGILRKRTSVEIVSLDNLNRVLQESSK